MTAAEEVRTRRNAAWPKRRPALERAETGRRREDALSLVRRDAPRKTPRAMPVDITLSLDDKSLWVNTFADGTTRLFDVSNPHDPKEVYSKKIGTQVNMVVQSWDGERVYFTSSLLAKWDKKEAENEHFLKLYKWDGKELKHEFTVDFVKEELGRPHDMKFGTVSTH